MLNNFENKNDSVSVIFQSRNESPKHILLKRNHIILFFVGLPLIALIGISLAFIGLIHTSPFHLIDNYRKNSEARQAIYATNQLRENLRKSIEENLNLKQEINSFKVANNQAPPSTTTNTSNINQTATAPANCPTPKEVAPMAQSIGLSTLTFIKPVTNQKDKTQPASLSLKDFNVVSNNKETINLQFNIINLLGGDVKLSGHILVLMKNEQQIQFYPMNALTSTREYQVSYSSGEPFATQRFRPVDASFLRPKKSGNYTFTVFIFAKNGDLIHFQTVYLPVKI